MITGLEPHLMFTFRLIYITGIALGSTIVVVSVEHEQPG